MVVLLSLHQRGDRLPGIAVWEFSTLLFGAPRILLHNLMELSILVSVISIATWPTGPAPPYGSSLQ